MNRSMVCVIAMAVGPSIAQADTHYVSKDGHQLYPYNTEWGAARQIAIALAAASPYDTVQVGPGDYMERITVPPTIALVGSGPDLTVIRDPGPAFGLDSTVRLKGLTDMEGFTIAPWGVGVEAKGEGHIEVRNCVVLGGDGMRLTGEIYVEHCTVTFCNVGIRAWRIGLPPRITSSIIWGNAVDVDPEADVVFRGCDIGDPAYAGGWGNISEDPLFIAWGDLDASSNPIVVDAQWQGDEMGTPDSPFRSIARAASSFSLHLGIGSPCLPSGYYEENMGAFPEETPSLQPGNAEVGIEVREGIYLEPPLLLLPGTRFVRGAGQESPVIIAIGDPALRCVNDIAIEGLSFHAGPSTATCVIGAPGAVIRRCELLDVGLDCGGAALVSECTVRRGGIGVRSDTLIERCTILDSRGSGIFIELSPGSPHIRDCRIVGCWRGISSEGWGHALIERCVIERSRWVGVHCVMEQAPTFVDCVISGDPSLSPRDEAQQRGGVFAVEQVQGSFINCTVEHVAVGFELWDSVSTEFVNCVTHDVDQLFGQIEYRPPVAWPSKRPLSAIIPLFVNCTFSDYRLGFLTSDEGTPQLSYNFINCILGRPSEATVLYGNTGIASITYSCIEGGWPGEGNIDAHPMFVDPERGDFRLKKGSPCIDTGDNGAAAVSDTDIAGMRRILYGGKSLTVDMGAYEYYINELEFGPAVDEATLTWSSLPDRSYSIFYSADLLAWHLADGNVPEHKMTTSWIDDGSLTGVPPSLVPLRFYRVLENP